MARVPLEVTLMAAHGLELDQEPLDRSSSSSSSSTSTAAVYAVIYLVSGCDVVHAMHRTPPDDSGGNNPEWGFTAGFSVPLEDIEVQDLLFSLICSGAGAEYGVGDVRVPVGELLTRMAAQSTEDDPPWSSEFSYPVKTPWGWRRGTLCFRVRCVEIQVSAAAGERSTEWLATGVPAAATAPLALTPAYEEPYLPDDSKFWRRCRRNNDKLLAFLLAMSLVSWLLLVLLLLFYVLLSQVGSSLRPPLPVILVCGYPALQRPAVPPPAPAAKARRPRWPAILLLCGLLAIIRCCT